MRWGAALAGFCREASPVARVAWQDWTSPTGTGDHLDDITGAVGRRAGQPRSGFLSASG